MGRGVRVTGPRVPASMLISHRRGGVRGSSCAATSSARFARQSFHDRVLPAMAPGSFSRRTVSQRPGNSGPRTPVLPAATRYAPQHPLKRTGAGSPGRANLGHRETATPARKTSQQGSGVPGPLSVPGICQKGQWSHVTCAPVVVAYRVGHAFFGPMRLPAGRPGTLHFREQAPPDSPCRG